MKIFNITYPNIIKGRSILKFDDNCMTKMIFILWNFSYINSPNNLNESKIIMSYIKLIADNITHELLNMEK